MILNKEKGKRMWGGDGGSGSGGSGGLNPSALAGYAQQSWVEGNYVSKTFFNQLFELQYSQRVLTKDGDTVISDVTTDMVATPNTFIDTTTQTRTDEETGYTIQTTNTITGIKAKMGLWTPSYLSALGQNASGGGGGVLLEPLLSINNSGLAAPTDAQDGMTVVWDKTTHKWKYGATGGGGGSVSWANITNKPTTISGFGITDAKIVNGTITLGNQSITPLTSSDISDMATKTWVNQQSFLTQAAGDNRYISIAFFARLFQAKNGSANVNPNDTTSTIDSIKALFGFWTDQYISALGQNSGGGGGGVSLNEPLSSINTSNMIAPSAAQNGMTIVWDNATSKWKYGAVGSGGTVTSIAMTVPTGFSVSPASITTSGTFAITFASGYSLPTTAKQSNWDTAYSNSHTHSNKSVLDTISSSDLSHWDAAYNWVNTNGAVTRTAWGQTYWNNGAPVNVTGSLTSVESITMSGWIHGTQCIEMNDDNSSNLKKYGGFIDFHFRDALGNKMSYDDDYSARLIEGDNGTLDGVIRCCTKNPNTKYSFFAEVGLRIGNARLVWDSDNNALKVEKYDGTVANFYATGGVSALGVPTSGSGTVDTLNVNTLKAVNNLYIGNNTNRIYFDSEADELVIKSGSDYISMNGVINMVGSTATTRAIYTNGGNLSLDGGRLYLAGGIYLFTSGSDIKVSINGTTYTLNKTLG